MLRVFDLVLVVPNGNLQLLEIPRLLLLSVADSFNSAFATSKMLSAHVNGLVMEGEVELWVPHFQRGVVVIS